MQQMDPEILAILAEKKLQGTLSEKEATMLQDWLLQASEQSAVQWQAQHALNATAEENEKALKARLLTKIQKEAGLNANTTPTYKMRPLFWRRAAAVVALLIGLSAGLVWMLHDHSGKGSLTDLTASSITHISTNDVSPGSNGAVLTLADGSKINLDSTKDGLVQHLAGVDVTLKNGALLYNDNKENGTAAAAASPGRPMAQNTISTAYGKQFKIVLPDGTVAWLNAGSSLKYPTHFNATARSVEMTGEVYFEVAKQMDKTGKRLPFRVHAGRQIIEVVGTHFDVSAYNNEPAIRTTLAEGSVRVVVDGLKPISLVPGQQSIVKPGAADISVHEVDAAAVTSWTRGFFSFHGASIQEVMRQLARWYDVKVDYATNLPNRRFSGKIYRTLNASSALEALSFMHLHFEIKKEPGKDKMRIKVTP